jgi:hypothetical protein
MLEKEYYTRRIEARLSVAERALLMIIAELNKPMTTAEMNRPVPLTIEKFKERLLCIRQHIHDYEKSLSYFNNGSIAILPRDY